MRHIVMMACGAVLTTLIALCVSGSVAWQDGCTAGSCKCPYGDDADDKHDPVDYVERGVPTGKEEEASVKVEELIMNAGYLVETHKVKTADGYLLTYHRIPQGKVDNPYVSSWNGQRRYSDRTPVLLQHGLLCSSAGWIMSPRGLGFVLADYGYDVWLGNARGNTYSRKHVKFDPDRHSNFWDFSWHEMGYYDLPAGIDYILQETGKSRLFYIGHSMGTTMYFVLGATRPEYMAKVKAAILLSPIMYLQHIRTVFTSFIPLSNLILKCVYKGNELFAQRGPILWVNKHICGQKYLRFACRGLIFAAAGFNKEQFDEVTADNIFNFFPAGMARKVLLHYIQIVKSGYGFRHFDYGTWNYWTYKTLKPPEYNIDRITTPIYLYYAENDLVLSPKDALLTASKLPNVKKVFKVPMKKFNHIDFMWAKDAFTLVFYDIVDVMQQEDNL